MKIAFTPVLFEDVRPALVEHLNALPAAVDSFAEYHYFDSLYFQIAIDGNPAGFSAIHGSNLITQFFMAENFKKFGQPVFAQIKKLGEVQHAFVPTCDEFFLSHALDEYRELRRQAYFFASPPNLPPIDTPLALQIATSADVPLITEITGDFFGDIQRLLDGEELFLAKKGGELVGFGVAEAGRLVHGVASIGMFVVEPHRQQGYGTAILRLLQWKCRRRRLRPIAGCWVYNHQSKKTLEKAGMYSQTRLLRISY